MGNKVKSNIAIICAACLLCGVLCGFSVPQGAAADLEADPGTDDRIDVYVDGILTTTGYVVGGQAVYISVSDFCSALKLAYAPIGAGDDGLCASFGEMTLCVPGSGDYMTANGRYFYLPYRAQVFNGEYCLPAEELSKLVCAEVQWDAATASIDIDTTNMGEIQNGDSFYNADDLKWLSRIIGAESGNQTLEGMMGVGNVVLNRVADPDCPDTVYGVVFDTRYGVQFSPVETGSIYLEPSDEAVVAAKLCLEGYNVAGESLYFVNPQTGSTAWFRETRTFVVTIGDHDFYA
jgi:N-acetylmuramoyl-L-alanine amidase